jgi:formylmethanofuran--tetrahydromethanopterin N-formyltransferase
VKCIYEVIVSGLRSEDISKAMKVSIESATKVRGVVKISSANYGGTLGKGRISLHELLNREG